MAMITRWFESVCSKANWVPPHGRYDRELAALADVYAVSSRTHWSVCVDDDCVVGFRSRRESRRERSYAPTVWNGFERENASRS
jgi:hypothetical protein